jgi:hypothetical protein
MTFDNIAVHLSSVTACKFSGNAETTPVNVLVFNIDRLHTEAVLPQMINPRVAAPSIDLLVDLNGDLTVGGAGRKQQRRGTKKKKYP